MIPSHARLWFPGMFFAWRVLSSFGWNLMLTEMRSQHRLWICVGQLNVCHSMPPTTLLIPDVMQMVAFAPSGDCVSSATHATTPASPRESAGPAESGSPQCKKVVWLYLYKTSRHYFRGKIKSCCWNDPKMHLSFWSAFWKRVTTSFLPNFNSRRNRYLN